MSWLSAVVEIPRIVCRVVCGLDDVIATFCPTKALVSVDLPALGRPTRQAKPARYAASSPWSVIVASHTVRVTSQRSQHGRRRTAPVPTPS